MRRPVAVQRTGVLCAVALTRKVTTLVVQVCLALYPSSNTYCIYLITSSAHSLFFLQAIMNIDEKNFIYLPPIEGKSNAGLFINVDHLKMVRDEGTLIVFAFIYGEGEIVINNVGQMKAFRNALKLKTVNFTVVGKVVEDKELVPVSN